jgi:hypothetical protein
MSQFTLLGRLIGLLIISLWLPLAATADGAEAEADVETLPFSDLSFPESAARFSAEQGCVEPDEEMRRNHMNFILHQRDETVHEGIRTRQHSLEECVNCHASLDEEGDEYLPINSEGQFCNSCHSYTAVNIDCFQCHATKPERSSTLHKLSGTAIHHSDQTLNSDTLQILAAEGKSK